METLFENEYHEVTSSPAERLIRVTRSALPFASIADAEASFMAMIALIDRVDVERYALLVDMRLGPGRNDDDFESVMAKHRAELFGRFPRRALLMRTIAGVLQAQRLSRESHGAFQVEAFTDEESALAYLRGGR